MKMIGKREDRHITDILVIGATGYAGEYVASAFAQAGYQVAALQRPGGRPVPGTYRRVDGDLEDPSSLTAAAEQFDLVVQVGRIEGEPERAGAEALLASGALLIHTSGADVLGPGYTDEDTTPDPPPIVAWRKEVERTVLDGGGIVVRPGLIYGNEGGVVQDMMVPLANRVGAGVYLGGGVRWPVVHVEDLAQLYVLAAELAPAGTGWNGCAENISVEALAAATGGGRAICWPQDEEAPPEIREISPLYLMDHVVSAEKTRRNLGWDPVYDSVVEYFSASQS